MKGHRLQDLISRGLGMAARHIGSDYDAFRPISSEKPMAPMNRYLRLPAAFSTESGSFRQPVGYGHAGWSGIFDTAYTQVGDYLKGPGGVFFIAAQQSLLPSLCILTNHTLSVMRPVSEQHVGSTGYGGITRGTLRPVLTEWPASVLAAAAGGATDLPGEAGTARWTILFPPTSVSIQPADLIHDETGAAYIVASAELSSLGWQLVAKQAET